ncbi:MAG: hypothetical protein ABGY42_09255 [bacterium]|jgi:hypothetical protein
MTRLTFTTTALAVALLFATPVFASDLVIHPGDAAFGSGEMRLEPNATFASPRWASPQARTESKSEGRAQYSAIASYTLGKGGAEVRMLPWADGAGSLRPGAQVALTW